MAAELRQRPSIPKVFGENVRRYRELAEISRFQLKAEAMLDDRQIPTLLTMERIADALRIPLSVLLSEIPAQTTFPLSVYQQGFDRLSPSMQSLLLSIMRDFMDRDPRE
mgnify:CR=1 FL=1